MLNLFGTLLESLLASSGDIQDDIQERINKLTKSPNIAPKVIEKLLKDKPIDEATFRDIMMLLVGNTKPNVTLKNLSKIKVPGAFCGKAIDALDFVWTCKTCELKKIESCVPCYCNTCFIKENHEGHKSEYHLGSSTATCDCGDAEWFDPKCFCPAHKKSSESVDLEIMLPKYNKNVTPKIINALQKQAHAFLIKVPPNNPLHYVAKLYLSFQKLISSTQAFTKMITSSFFLKFPEHMTRHKCEPESYFDCTNAVELHPCTCTVLEAFTRHLLIFGESESICNFIVELVRLSPEFAEAIFGAFWRNYCHLFYVTIIYNKRTEILYRLLWQCCIEDKAMKKFIPLYHKHYISCLKYSVDCMRKHETSKIEQYSYFLMYDFASFMNTNNYMGMYFIQHLHFLTGYTSAMLDLEFSNNLVKGKESEDSFIPTIANCLEYFMRIFCFILRNYEQTNVKATSYLFLIFKAGLQRIIKETPDIKELNSFNIPFMRCFSYFLNKFIYISFNENEKVPNFRSLLINYFAMKEEEFDTFVYEILRRVIRAHNFISEINGNIWHKVGMMLKGTVRLFYGEFKGAFVSPDIALIQNLMMVLPENKVDIEELLQLSEDEILEEDKINSNKLRDNKLYELCCMLFNSDCRAECYVRCLKDEYSKLDPERAKHIMRKEAIVALLGKEKAFKVIEHIDIKSLIKEFPPFLRDPGGEEFLESLFILKPNYEYAIGAEALKYYDYASYLSKSTAIISEFNVSELVKKFPSLSLLQIPLRRKEDEVILGGILNALDKNKTIDIFKELQKRFKDKPVNLESSNTLFLKIALEVVKSERMSKEIKEEFLKSVAVLDVNSELLITTKKTLLEKPEVEEVKAEDVAADKIKRQQKKIKEEYAARMNIFAKKHLEELKISETKSSQQKEIQEEICVICKEGLDDIKPLGRLHIRLANKHCIRLLQNGFNTCGMNPGNIENFINKEDSAYMIFKSCGHYTHADCFDAYSKNMICPACKTFVTGILPVNPLAYISQGKPLHRLISLLFDFKKESPGDCISYYICKSIYVSANTDVEEFMERQLKDIKYMYRIMLSFKEEGKEFESNMSFVKPHLMNLLNKCEEGLVLEEVKDGIGWVLFRSAFLEAKEGEVEKKINEVLNKEDVVEDAARILIEVSMLLSAILNWDKEKISTFLDIIHNEDPNKKLAELQNFLFPSLENNIISESAKKFLSKGGLPVEGKIASIANLNTTLKTNSSSAIAYTIAGTVKGKISLIGPLPEDFTKFQLTYYLKNCTACNLHSKNKCLCLICGEIVCVKAACCPNELYEHANTCNRGICVYIHTYYGAILITWLRTDVYSDASLYRMLNNRSILPYTTSSKVFFSKDLREYKLSEEAYKKLNNDYVTNKLQFVFNKDDVLS